MKPPMKPPIPGAAVDAAGGIAIDPTQNVRDLSEASNRRQDDLREAQNELMNAKLAHIAEIAMIRDGCQKEIAALRAEHSEQLNAKESSRLDAIRAVDQLNVSTAAAQAQQAIQTLATTTASAAQTAQGAVTATATTMATALANTVDPILKRIAALEQSSYEGKGRQGIADPQSLEMIAELKAMRLAMAGATAGAAGKEKGAQPMNQMVMIAIGAGISGIVALLIGAVVFVLKMQ